MMTKTEKQCKTAADNLAKLQERRDCLWTQDEVAGLPGWNCPPNTKVMVKK